MLVGDCSGCSLPAFSNYVLWGETGVRGPFSAFPCKAGHPSCTKCGGECGGACMLHARNASWVLIGKSFQTGAGRAPRSLAVSSPTKKAMPSGIAELRMSAYT